MQGKEKRQIVYPTNHSIPKPCRDRSSLPTASEFYVASLWAPSTAEPPHGLYSPWDSPGQNTGVGSCSLLQGIFPTQESNRGLLHCRRILYWGGS